MDNDQTYKDIGSVTQWTDSLGSNLDPRGETKKKGTKKDKHEGKKHKKKKKGVCDTGEYGCGGLPMEGFINKLDQSPPDSREDLVNPVGEPELEKIQQRTQETEDALILQKQQEEETTRPLAFQEETDKGFNTPPENTVTVLAEVYDAQDDTREPKKKKKKKGKKKLSKSMSELDVDESEVTSKKSKKLKKITSKSISNLKNPNAIETPLPSCSVDVEYVHSIGLSVANSTDITDNNASGSVQNDAPIDASYSSGSKDLAVKKDDRLASVTSEVDESEDVITSEVIARGYEGEQEREEMECMDGTDEKQKHDNLETEHDLIGCTGHDSQTVTMVDPYIHAKKKHSFLTEESGLYNDLIDGNSRDDLSIHAPIDSFMPAEEKPSMADDPLVLLEEEKHPTKRKKKGSKSLEDLLIKDKSKKKKKKIKDTLSKSMDESKEESVADQLKESMDTVELTSTQIESVPIKDTTELRAEGATLEPPTTLRSITNDHSDYSELGLPSQEEEMLDSAVTTVSGTKEVTDETTLHSKTKKLKKRTSKSQENLSEEDGTKKRKAKKAAKLCKSMDFLELNEPNVSRDHTEQHKEKTKKKKSKKNKDISKSVEDVVIDDSTPDCGVLQDSEIIKQHTIGVDESSNAFNDVDVGCSIGNSMDQMPETPEDCPPANLEGIQDSGISSGTKDDSDVINMDNNEDSPPCTARNPDTLSDVVRLDDSTIRKQSFTEDHNDYCALDLPSQVGEMLDNSIPVPETKEDEISPYAKVKKLKKRTSKSQEDLSDEENKKKRKSEKAKILSKSMDLLDFNDPNLPKMQSEHKQKTKKKKNKDTSMFLDNMVIEATISDVPGHCIPVEPRLGVNILPDESINVVPFADSPQNTPPDYHDNSHNPGDLDENHPQHDLPLKKKKKSSSANDCKKKKILSDSMNILDSGDATNKSTKKKKYNKLTNSASDIVPETIPTEIEFRETASENVVEPDVLDGKKDIPVVEMGSSTIIDEPSDLTDITHIENFDNDTSDKTDAQKDGQDIKEDNMESLPADHHNKDNDITGTDKLEADKLEKKKKKETKKSKTCGVLAGVSCEHEENQIGNKEDYGLLEEIAKGGQSLGADLSLPFITNTFNNVDDEPLASKNVSVTGESKEDESNLLDPRQKRSFMEDFVEYNHDNQIALQDDNGDVQHVTRDLLDSIHHDMESMTSTNKPALPAQDNKQGVNDQQPIQPQSDIYQPEVTKKSKKKSKHQDGNSEKIKNKKKKTKKDEKLSRSMGDITNDFVPEIPEAIVADQVAQQLASEDMEVCESIVQTSMGTEHKSEGGKKSKSKKKKKMKLKAKSMGDLVLNTEMDADAAKKKKKKPKKEKDLTSEQIRDACVVTDGSAVIAKAEATNTTNVKELDTIAIPAQSSLMTEEFYNVALPNEKSNLQQNDTDYSIQAYMDDETFEADQTARAMLAYNRVVSNLRDKFLEESTIESDSQSFSVSDSLTVNPLRFYVPDKHSTPKNMLPSDMSIVSLDREPGQMGNKGQPEVEVDQAENKFDSFQANAESMELHDESLQDNPLKYYAPDKHSTPKFMDPNDLAKFQKDHPYQTNLVEIGEEVEPEKEFQSMELHEESLIDNPLKINSPDKHSTPRRMDPKVLADIGKEMGVLNEDLDPVDRGNKERLEAGTTTDENTMISSQEDSLRENPLQFYAPNKHSTPKVMTFEDFHLMSMEKEPGSQHSYGIDALIEDVHNTEVIEEAPVQTEDSNAIQKPAILKSNKSEKGSEKVDDEKPFEKTSDLPETSVLKEPMLFDQYHSSIESCRHIVTTPRELKRMKKAKSSKKLKGGNLSANVELSKSEGNISEEATEPKEMKSVSGAKSESNLDYSDNTEASKKKKKRKKSKLSAKSEPSLTTMNEESNISLKKTTKNKSDSLAAKSEPVLNVEEETLCEDSEKKKKKKKKQSLSAKSEFSVGLDCDVEESQNSSREKTRKTKREVKSMSAKSEPSLIIDDHSEEQPELKKENEKKKKIEKMSAKSEPTLTIENPSEEQPGVKKKKKKKKIEKMSAKSEPSLQACKETLQTDKAHQLERSVTLPKVKKKKRSMDLDSPIPTGQQPELQFPDQHPLSNQSAAPDDLDIIIPSHEATRPVSLDDQVLNTDNLDAPIPVGGQPLKSTESMKRQNAARKTNNDDDIYDEISEYSKTTHKTIVGVADISGESGDLDAFIPHGTSGESDAFSDYQPLEVLDVSAPSPDLPPLPPLPPSIGNRPPISEYENVEFKQSDSPQDWVPSSGLGNIDVDIPLPKSPNPKDKTITKKLAMGISKLKDTISKIGKGKQKDEDDVDPYKAVDKEDKEPPCYDITEMAKNMPSFFPEFQDQFEYENSDEQDDDDDDTLYVIDVKRDAYPPGWHFRDRRCTLEPIMEEASSLGDVYESMDGAGCVTNRRMYSSDSKLEIREQGYVYDDDIYDVIDSGRDIQAEKMLGSGDFELLKSIVRESKNSASSTTSSDDEIYLEPTSLTGLSISAVYEGDDASSASILIDDTYEIPVDWRDQSRTSKDTITTPEEPLLAEDRNTRIKELVSSIVQASVDSALEVVTQSVKETGEENTEIPFIDDPEDEPSMEEDVVIATEKKVEELCYFEPVIIKEDITELSLADSSFGKASNPSVPMMQPAEKVVEIEAPSAQQAISLTPLEAPSAQQAVSLTSSFEIPKVDEGQLKTMEISLPEDQPENADLQPVSLKPSVEIPKVDDTLPESMEISLPDDQAENDDSCTFVEMPQYGVVVMGASTSADDVASPDALNESQWHEETTEHINNTNQQLDDTIRHFKLIREKLEQAQEEIQCTEERIEQPYPSEEFMRNVQDYVHNIICAAYSQTLHEIRLEQIDEERAVDSDDSYLSAEDTPPCMLDGSEEEGLDKADTTLEYNINTESAHSKEEQMVRLDDVNTMDVVTTVQIESFLDDEVTICCESFTQTPVNHLRSMETQTEKRTLSSFISDSETLVPTSDDEDLYDDLPYDGPQRGTEGFIEDSLMPVTSTPALSAKSTMDVTEHLATKEFQELEIQTDLKMDEIVTATETGIQTHTSPNRTTQDNSCQTHSAVESQTDSLPVFTSSQAGSQWPLQDISDTQTEEISTRTQCLQVDKADIIASQSIASQADTNTSMDHQTQVSKYEIVNSRSASVETNFLEQCHSGTQVKPYEIPARDSFEVQTTSTAEAKSVQVGHHELYNHKNAGQQVEMYKMCSVGTQAQKTAVHSCGYTQTPEVISIPNQTQVNSWEMKSSTEKSIQATSTYFNAGVGTDAPITMARTVQVTREDLVKNFDKHVQSEETIFGKTTSSSTQTAKPKSFESSSQIHSWHFSTNVMLQTNTDELVSKSSAETQTNQNITSPQATRSTVVRPKDLVSTTVFGLPLSEWNTKAVVGTERTDSPSQTNSLATRVANTQVDSRDIVPQINVSTSAPPKSTYSGDSTTQVYSHDVVENTDEHSQIDQSEILRWFAQSKSVQSESCQISTSSQTQIDTVDFDNTSQTIDDDWEDAYQKRAGTSRSSSSTGVQTMDTFVDDFQHKNDIESVDVKQYFQSYLYYEKKPASPIAFSETLIVPNTTHAMRASPNLDWSQDQARAVTPLSEESLDVSRGSSWYSDNLNNPSLAVIALHHPEDQMKPRRKIPPATFPKPKKLTKKVPPKTLPKPKFPLSRIYQRDPNVKASSPPGPRPSFTPNLLKADQVPLTGPGQPSGQPTDQVTPYQSQQGGPQTTAFCLTGAPTTQAVPSASRRRRSRSEYPTTEMYAPEQEDCVFV